MDAARQHGSPRCDEVFIEHITRSTWWLSDTTDTRCARGSNHLRTKTVKTLTKWSNYCIGNKALTIRRHMSRIKPLYADPHFCAKPLDTGLAAASGFSRQALPAASVASCLSCLALRVRLPRPSPCHHKHISGDCKHTPRTSASHVPVGLCPDLPHAPS